MYVGAAIYNRVSTEPNIHVILIFNNFFFLFFLIHFQLQYTFQCLIYLCVDIIHVMLYVAIYYTCKPFNGSNNLHLICVPYVTCMAKGRLSLKFYLNFVI